MERTRTTANAAEAEAMMSAVVMLPNSSPGALLPAAGRDVLDDVAAQLVAVPAEVGRVVLRDPLVGARQQDVGFEQPLLVELLQPRQRGVELLHVLVGGG